MSEEKPYDTSGRKLLTYNKTVEMVTQSRIIKKNVVLTWIRRWGGYSRLKAEEMLSDLIVTKELEEVQSEEPKNPYIIAFGTKDSLIREGLYLADHLRLPGR